MAETLEVWLNEDLAGRLSDERGRLTFAYDAGWLGSERFIPLSVTMRPAEAPYPDEVARPFFENLLPEGDIRAAVARLRHVSARNTFALLGEIGGDCAGAVSLWPHGERPRGGGGYAALTEARLAEVLAKMAQRPLLVIDDALRLSLAGAQNKLPVHVDASGLSLPRGGSPSSHILKPGARGFAHMTVNEHLCMRLADALGLSVPASTVLRKPEPLYLVERYDRRRSLEGALERIHQIDFCQALNLPSHRKYEHEGGPSLEACFDVITRFSAVPARDRLRLISWVIFNFLIGNSDAHAKNLALLITRDGATLAPFYDLVSTAVYPDLTDRLALKIGGENRPDCIRPRHWEALAKASGANPRIVRERIAALAGSILPAAREVAAMAGLEEGESATIEEILGVIAARAKLLPGSK